MDTLRFRLYSFQELTTTTLYDLLKLRQQVFIVEQDCPYLDTDGKDLVAHHLLGYINNDLVCYTRLLDKGISYPDYCSIGRVVNAENVRGKGVGKQLMQKSIETCKDLYPNVPIKISAQSYLQKFYESLGFIKTGEEYLEDDIPHMGMILK